MNRTTALTVIAGLMFPAAAHAQGTTKPDAGASSKQKGPCATIQAHVNQMFADSITVLRQNGQLQPFIADLKKNGGLDVDISPANTPDSIIRLFVNLQASCEFPDIPGILKMAESAAADTAGKPRKP